MPKKVFCVLVCLASFILLLLPAGCAVEAPGEESYATWQEAYHAVLQAFRETRGSALFLLIDLDGNDSPELLVTTEPGSYHHFVELFDFSRGRLHDELGTSACNYPVFWNGEQRRLGTHFGVPSGRNRVRGYSEYVYGDDGLIEAAAYCGVENWDVASDGFLESFYRIDETGAQTSIAEEDYNALIADFERSYIKLEPHEYTGEIAADQWDAYWVK